MMLSDLKIFHSFLSPFLRSGDDSDRIKGNDSSFIKNPLPSSGKHNDPPTALCLRRANSIYKHRFSSSLGPLILLSAKKNTFTFALLYCAHTADIIAGKKFSFSRIHYADDFKAFKHYVFPGNQFHDLAVAHTTLPRGFCSSQLLKTQFKSVNATNIGDHVRILSMTRTNREINGKIKAVNDPASGTIRNPLFENLIQLDIRGIPGDSGSPVLSENNEVIGLAVRTDEEGYLYCNKLFDSKELFYQLYKTTIHKVDPNEVYLITL